MKLKKQTYNKYRRVYLHKHSSPIMTNYGSFMYLNNAGVKLLENELYQESIETFQDATDVYHDYCSQPDQHQQRHQLTTPVQQAQSFPTNLLNERDTTLQDILIRASKRLAKIRSDQTNITLRPRDSELDPMISLDTMNDEYFTPILLFERSIDKVDVVIRMSESSSSETNSSDWKLFYAMLIFNYSIACKRTSEVASETFSDEYQNQLRDQSRQFCQVSHRIVLDIIKNFTSIMNIRSLCHNRDRLRAILYALSLSTFCSCHILDMMYWSNSPEETTKYYDMFQKSFRFFLTLLKEYTYPFGTNSTKHAAAA
jgi:hypothetical protein